MTDWRKSRGHLLFLKEFQKPQNIDDLPAWIDWKLILGEEPQTAIQRFLDSGALVSASLSECVNCKFKVPELKDMLRNHGLTSSGRNKQDLIRLLIQTNPEDMKQAIMDLTLLKCSEQGEKIIEHFLTTIEQPSIRDDMFPAEKVKKVAKWILGAAGAGAVGGATYDALKRLVEAEVPAIGLFTELPESFQNPHEYNAEYILIPGGQYPYSVTEKIETIQDVYFAKCPVTNERYRHFIHYLYEEQEHGLLKILPKGEFDRRMTEFAASIKGFTEHLGNDPKGWPVMLLYMYFGDKRFLSENHPVANVSWFAARAYCYWLSLLELKSQRLPLGKAASLYRLPNEVEWEWAASGGKRVYPWGGRKPNRTLANYGQNVGTTTPVGSYPDGATPEGLMDMAGNVWEWMENWHEDYEGKFRSLRGSSWSSLEVGLRCTARFYVDPDVRYNDVGFRVVRSQS